MQSLLFPTAPVPADPTIADRLEICLRQVVRAAAAQQRAIPLLAAVIGLLVGRLGRVGNRFHALFAKFRAGTLPAPRARRPVAAPAAPASAERQSHPTPPSEKTRRKELPRERAWLVKLVGWQMAGAGHFLTHLLDDPEMQALLAAAPQARRLLRPLFRMLTVAPLPACLRLPPRPRRPRPPRPHAARAAREPGPTDAQIRRSLGLPAGRPRDCLASPPPAAGPPAAGPPAAAPRAVPPPAAGPPGLGHPSPAPAAKPPSPPPLPPPSPPLGGRWALGGT